MCKIINIYFIIDSLVNSEEKYFKFENNFFFFIRMTWLKPVITFKIILNMNNSYKKKIPISEHFAKKGTK